VTRLLVRWRRHTRSRGQALVEFALVLPIFLLLVFGLFDLGRVVYVNNALSEAAREGARWGSVQGRSATAADRTGIASETLDRMNAIPDPTVTVTCERDSVEVATCHSTDVLVVEAASPVALATPILGGLIGPLDLSAISRVVVHQ
jgi:Flp pilus assembly protein TadG